MLFTTYMLLTISIFWSADAKQWYIYILHYLMCPCIYKEKWRIMKWIFDSIFWKGNSVKLRLCNRVYPFRVVTFQFLCTLLQPSLGICCSCCLEHCSYLPALMPYPALVHFLDMCIHSKNGRRYTWHTYLSHC